MFETKNVINGLTKTGVKIKLGGVLTATTTTLNTTLPYYEIFETRLNNLRYFPLIRHPFNDQFLNKVITHESGKITITYSENGPIGVSDRSYASIVRLNVDGTRDTSFALPLSGFTGYDPLIAIAKQSTDKIIFYGRITGYTGTTIANNNNIWSVFRLNNDGSKDLTFKSGYADQIILSSVVQNDDKIILTGNLTNYSGSSHFNIVRLNSDGSVDETYNPTLSFGPFPPLVSGLQTGNTLVLATSYGVQRFSSSGTLLNSRTGVGTFTPSTNSPGAIGIQSTNKIIFGGPFTTFTGSSANRIVRLNADLTKDISFNVGSGFDDDVNYIEILPDDKILVSGEFTSFNGTSVRSIVRLNSDGTLDTSFNFYGGGSASVYGFSIAKYTPNYTFVCFGYSGNTLSNGTVETRFFAVNNDGSKFKNVEFKNVIPQYNGDYSPNYTSRSLVDKDYVNRYVTGVTSSINTSFLQTITGATNGLTKVGKVIRLGGSITDNTTISVASTKTLDIRSDGGNNSYLGFGTVGTGTSFIDIYGRGDMAVGLYNYNNPFIGTLSILSEKNNGLDIISRERLSGYYGGVFNRVVLSLSHTDAIFTDRRIGNLDLDATLIDQFGYALRTPDVDCVIREYLGIMPPQHKANVSCSTINYGDVDLITGGELEIDFYQTISGDRVLVNAQNDPTENGVYIVDFGSWTRSLDFDDAETDNITWGIAIFDDYYGTQWVLDVSSNIFNTVPEPIIIGTSELYFSDFYNITTYNYFTGSGLFQTNDGYDIQEGDRVLLTGDESGSGNGAMSGIWIASINDWIRATDLNNINEFVDGYTWKVLNGDDRYTGVYNTGDTSNGLFTILGKVDQGTPILNYSMITIDDSVNLAYGIGDENKGLQYEDDYSPNFTARSLVDAGFVTGITSQLVAGGITGGTNGLNVQGANIRLGGILTGETIVGSIQNSGLVLNDNQILGGGSGTTTMFSGDGTWGNFSIDGSYDLSYISTYRNTDGNLGNVTNYTEKSNNDVYYYTELSNGYNNYGQVSNIDFEVEAYDENTTYDSYINLYFRAQLNTIPTATIGSYTAGFAGMQYEADYSADYTARSLVDKGYVDAIVGGFVTLDKGTLDTLISSSGLTVGQLYIITDADFALYSGTTIMLKAATTSKLETSGHGIFYTPKYNQSTASNGYGIWSNYMSHIYSIIVGGPFTLNEIVTANNGATAKFKAIGFLEWVSGTWSSVTSFTGNTSNTKIYISGAVSPTYTIGQNVIWGGKHWINVNGNVGNSINKYRLNSEWLGIPFNGTDYNVHVDEITYDYTNNMIVSRKDKYNNHVLSNNQYFESIANIYNPDLGNPIKDFQWGNGFNNYEHLFTTNRGVSGNYVKDSYFDTLNFIGRYAMYNTLTENSLIYSNIFDKNSYIEKNNLSLASRINQNILTTSSVIAYNVLNNGVIQSNTLMSNSYLGDNSIKYNASISANILTESGIVTNNMHRGQIYYNTITYCYIESNVFLDGGTTNYNTSFDGNIYNNILNWNNSIGNNILNTNADIHSNVLNMNGSIGNNDIRNNSDISKNELNNGSIYTNILDNYGSISLNTIDAYGFMADNTLKDGGSITQNILSNFSNVNNCILTGSNTTFTYNNVTNQSSLVKIILKGTSSSIDHNVITNTSNISGTTLNTAFITNNVIQNNSIFKSTNTLTTSKNIRNNNFDSVIAVADFTSSTIISASGYTKTVFTRSDGAARIGYYNGSDVFTIGAVNS